MYMHATQPRPVTAPSQALVSSESINILHHLHKFIASPPKSRPPTRNTSAAKLPAPLPLDGVMLAEAVAALLGLLLELLLPILAVAPKTPPWMLVGIPLLLTLEAADLYADRVLPPELWASLVYFYNEGKH